MSITIYFDTCVLRYFGETFHKNPIDMDIRPYFAISPISVLELLGQLGVANAEAEAFRAVQTLLNICDPERIEFLPWVDEAIRVLVFDLPQAPSEMNGLLRQVVIDILRANSPTDVQYVHDLRRLLNEAKEEAVKRFCELLESYRRNEHEDAFVKQMAMRAGFPHQFVNHGDLRKRLDALWTYMSLRLKNAANTKDYNPFSGAKKNDTFDAEQLLYLAHPGCHFLTSDKRFKCAAESQQYSRIHVEPTTTFDNRSNVIELVRRIAGD